ncbi:MAG: metallophosphoesterase [Heliobacteriaceae bacterium]|jgi:3',5'-cyclic AMP phosphodiesterase CpdA|nr:metallophosphoesterase [Heliobacteriaceae bacterium]
MKKFLSILIILLIAAGTAFANEIKFIQVTDAHYSSPNAHSKEVLERTVQDINKQSGIAFVIFTGDNIDSANPEYLKEFVHIVNKLKYPYYTVIGNHDVFKNGGLSKERYIEIIRKNHLFYTPRKPNYVFEKDGFVFIVADGAKEVIPGPGGYFKEDTLKWLVEQLKKYDDRPVGIFQHFPLIEPRVVKSHRTYEAEKYLDLLKQHNNVIAVVSGHYHTNGETTQDGIYHISSPSLLSDPNYYKIITIVTTKGFSPMIYTELKEATGVGK